MLKKERDALCEPCRLKINKISAKHLRAYRIKIKEIKSKVEKVGINQIKDK